MTFMKHDQLAEETQEDAESAILRGLHYLEREASQAKLGNLAIVIKHARSVYISLTREQERTQ